MKIWVTKYALTKGILEYEAELSPNSPTMVKVPGERLSIYFHGDDWYRSKSDAIDRANDMRDARIKSLEKTLARLRRLEFTA